MCVHLLRFDVNLIVTCDGSNGFIKALPDLSAGIVVEIDRRDFTSNVVRDSDITGEPFWD